MANLTDVLSFDIIEKVVKHLDINSFAKFKYCCKTTNNAASQEIFRNTLIDTVNKRLCCVIEIIKEYHDTLNQNSVRQNTIHTLLNQLYLKLKQNPLEYVNLVQYMLGFVAEKANSTRDEVLRVWFMYMNNYVIKNENQLIVKELEIFALSKSYSLMFEFTDCKNQGKYYIQLEIEFNDEQQPMLGFTMQDIINNKYTNEEDMKKYLENAEYDQDGFIRFVVSNENMLALSKFIVNVMGLDVFVFETSMISYIKCHSRLWSCTENDFIEKQENKYVNREEYREKIIDILDGFMD